MVIYIVTVKLAKNPDHNPADKRTGSCPFSATCTDLTGEHHSFLEASTGDAEQVREAVAARGYHVTRIEVQPDTALPSRKMALPMLRRFRR